ncbi:MAG: amidohydrolase family protein [Candidatus Bathyarchaeia archaeon]
MNAEGSNVNRPELQQEIRGALDGMRLVDHHDHLTNPFLPKPSIEMDLPFFLTQTYLRGDLVASGMPETLMNAKSFEYLTKPDAKDESEQRWKELKPYLENVRSSAYYRYLLIALRDLYGFEADEVDDGNWQEVSARIRERSREGPAWSMKVLDRMNVYRMILDISGTGMPNTRIVKDERLVHVVRMDGFINGDPQAARSFTDRPTRSLDQYLEALDEAFEAVVKAGAVGVKSGLAYERILSYEPVAKPEAERVYARGLSRASAEGRKAFQDFVMHEVCERCARHRLPFQVHTGIQAGNYNTVTNANPTHLTNLVRKFPDVRFDLFHGGYPYMQEAALMAKYFPNVYLDGCWLAHITPAGYKRGLDEWIELLPGNKVFAWGGDHGILEHSYASLMLAKDLIAEVLARKVASGYFPVKTALGLAEKILGENSIKVYGF